jgi:hypothetical protein
MSRLPDVWFGEAGKLPTTFDNDPDPDCNDDNGVMSPEDIKLLGFDPNSDVKAGGPGSGRKPSTEDKAIGALIKHGYTGKPDTSTGGIMSVYRKGEHSVVLNHMKETFSHWAPGSSHVTGEGRWGKLPGYLKQLHG